MAKRQVTTGLYRYSCFLVAGEAEDEEVVHLYIGEKKVAEAEVSFGQFTVLIPLLAADAIVAEGLQVRGTKNPEPFPIGGHQYQLDKLTPPEDYHTFASVYHIPSTRIKDDDYLDFLCTRFARDERLSFSKRSAALTVLMYRPLNSGKYDAINSAHLKLASELIAMSHKDTFEWGRYRWRSSLGAVCGYTCLFLRDREEAMKWFRVVTDVIPYIEKSPGTTHILIASLLMAHIEMSHNNNPEAAFAAIEPMADVVRKGTMLQPIERIYGVAQEQAYGLRLLEEALLIKAEVKPGSVLYAPPGKTVDFANLKPPLNALYKGGFL